MICKKCLINKDISEFYFRKDSNKYRSACKECVKARVKYYAIKNVEVIKNYQREYNIKNRIKLVQQRKKYFRRLFEYKQWRTEVYQRDNYTCQECFIRGNYLHADHKKAFVILFQEFLQEYNQFSPFEDKEILVRIAINYKSFWNIDNGQTLCKDCHKLTKNYAKNFNRR